MITRYALFEGSAKPGMTESFRSAVLDRLVPLWKQFASAQKVRVMFGEERDEGASEFPLILAISYPDRAAMDQACKALPGHNPARSPAKSWPSASTAVSITMSPWRTRFLFERHGG